MSSHAMTVYLVATLLVLLGLTPWFVSPTILASVLVGVFVGLVVVLALGVTMLVIFFVACAIDNRRNR